MSKRLEELNKKMSELSRKKDDLKTQEGQIRQQIKNEMDKERSRRIHSCGEYLYKFFVKPELLSLDELRLLIDYLFTSNHMRSLVQWMIEQKQADPNADVTSRVKEYMQKQKEKDKGKETSTSKPDQPIFSQETVETSGEFITSGNGDSNPYSIRR